jgi:hypothetical protein
MERKLRFINFIAHVLLGNEYSFTVIRKGYLKEIAREVSRYPQSKITALRILRLDGTDFKAAMEMYEGLFK